MATARVYTDQFTVHPTDVDEHNKEDALWLEQGRRVGGTEGVQHLVGHSQTLLPAKRQDSIVPWAILLTQVLEGEGKIATSVHIHTRYMYVYLNNGSGQSNWARDVVRVREHGDCHGNSDEPIHQPLHVG